MADSRELTTDHVMTSNGTEPFREGTGRQDLNCNTEDDLEKIAKPANDYVGHEQDVSFPSQGTPSAIPSDPLLRQAYAMPAAGFTTPQRSDQSPSRNYRMASDIFGTGLDRSWTASPGSVPANPKLVPLNNITGYQSAPQKDGPGSFKITEIASPPSTPTLNEEQPDGVPAGRRARESSGNPLTGQGFDRENAKTGKRYFEGSNANQKLW